MVESADTYEDAVVPDGDQASDRRLEVGAVVAERYRVVGLLGEGGMGAVYQVQHVHMHKMMALKVLHRDKTEFPEAVARFEREAVASGRIEHDNVIVATDFGRLDDGSFFLVLELAVGRSLREVLQAEGALSPQRCAHIGRQIASALSAAHALGIVHRDLKPENVMLMNRDGDPDFVKVLDFGIAKVQLDDARDGPALTRIGEVFGTPEYMSPEQAMGQQVDARSDLYALGVLLYEMATGRVPFESDQVVGVLALQITSAPPTLPSDVPLDLAALIETLLAKDALDRVQTAAEVACRLNPTHTPSCERPALPSEGSAEAMLPTAVARKATPKISKAPGTTAQVEVSHPSLAGAVAAAARATLHSYEKLAPALQKPVRVGTATFPAWLPIAGGAAVLSLVLFAVGITVAVLSALDGDQQVATAHSGVIPRLVWTPPATSGNAGRTPPVDIARIEAIPISRRTIDDWMALGRGYSQAQRYKESASTYRTALQVERRRSKDPQLLADMRMAARDPDAYPLVLNVAEGRAGLRDTGLDLLWDVWLDLRALGERERASTTLKKLLILSQRASKALRVAIELQTVTRCGKASAIVARAAEHADARALPRLQEMQRNTTCAATSSEPCFACLLGSSNLARAIDRAQRQPPPQLEHGYR